MELKNPLYGPLLDRQSGGFVGFECNPSRDPVTRNGVGESVDLRRSSIGQSLSFAVVSVPMGVGKLMFYH